MNIKDQVGVFGLDYENNLEKFVKLTVAPNVQVGVSITVSILNVYYLPELIEFLLDKGIDHYFYNMLIWPDAVNIDNLTPMAKKHTLQKLEQCNLPDSDKIKLQPVINYIKQSKTSDGKTFIDYVKHKDQFRGENFMSDHNEIAKLMGYML